MNAIATMYLSVFFIVFLFLITDYCPAPGWLTYNVANFSRTKPRSHKKIQEIKNISLLCGLVPLCDTFIHSFVPGTPGDGFVYNFIFNIRNTRKQRKVSLTGFPTASLRRGEIPGFIGLVYAILTIL